MVFPWCSECFRCSISLKRINDCKVYFFLLNKFYCMILCSCNVMIFQGRILYSQHCLFWQRRYSIRKIRFLTDKAERCYLNVYFLSKLPRANLKSINTWFCSLFGWNYFLECFSQLSLQVLIFWFYRKIKYQSWQNCCLWHYRLFFIKKYHKILNLALGKYSFKGLFIGMIFAFESGLGLELKTAWYTKETNWNS